MGGRVCGLLPRHAAAASTTLTGNPVRPEMLGIDREHIRDAIRARLGVAPDQVLVVATGGSLGALTINRAVLEAAGRWRDRDDLVVHHVDRCA